MTDIQISPATRRQAYWASGREFVHLPEVDPAFNPTSLKGLRRFLLRHLILPMNYHRKLQGLILEQEGQPSGYLFLRERALSLHIESMGVEAPHRRRGYARRLVEHAEGIAKKEELDYMTAAITPENGPAKAFFEALGFRSFRSKGWRLPPDGELASEEGPWTVEELSPRQLLDAYHRWLEHELRNGDPGAADMILGDYRRATLRTAARHWACLLDGEEVGYLRVAGLLGKYDAYLAADRSTWESPAQASWLAQALAVYPTPPRTLTLDLASGGHYDGSQAVWEGAGLTSWPRLRYMCWKRLGGEGEAG